MGKANNIDFLRYLRRGFIVIFLAWITFFPEPLHQEYWIWTEAFLGASLLILLLARKSENYLFALEDWPLWLFLLTMIGAVFSAQNKTVAIKTYLDVFLIMFLLYYLLKDIFSSRQNTLFIIKIICVFSMLLASFAILEWSFGKNFIYEHLIENPYYYRYMHGSVRRPMATQLHTPILASYLLGCLPFSLLLIKGRSSFFRKLSIASLVLNCIVIILTFSRGVSLGLIALCLFYAVMKRNIRFLTFFLVIVMGFVVLCSWTNNLVFSRFGFRRFVFGSYDSVISPYRMRRVKMTIDMVRDNPFFGVGLNQFRLRFNEYKVPEAIELPYEFMIADNMYLTILAETGIVGFSAFLILIFYLLWKGINNFYSFRDKEKKVIVLIGVSAFIGLLVNMGSYELFYWHNPFAIFCLLCGLIMAGTSRVYD